MVLSEAKMEKPDEKVKDSSGSKESMADGAVKHAADADVQPGPDSASIKDQVTESTNESKINPEEEEDEGTSVEEVVSGLATAASGWFSGWMKTLETAKEKSAEVYGMVKKDLGEFSEAVQAETSAMLTETGTMIHSTSQTLKDSLQMQTESSTASHVKKSVSGFLTHVQKAFTPDTMQDDDTEAYVLRDGQPVLLDRLQTELHRLAGEPQTYLADIPESELVRYEVWSADLDLEARQTELSDLLASNRAILEQYTRLVPAQVSHATFWNRYLFRVHLAEEREKQREQLRRRADQMTSPGAAEKQVAWEEDSQGKKDFSHHVEVTDAQADRLLEEYDKEQQKRRSSPPAAAAAAAATAGDDRPGSQSPGHVSSNEDDWVKEDLETETNSSVGNDWEKWD